MKKVSVVLIILISLFITGCSEKTYTYNLPNDYVITKKGELNTKLGKLEDGKVIIKRDSKVIGVDMYIAEFAYGKRFITLKCIDNSKEELQVVFYLIDSKYEDVYGPFMFESTYEEVKSKIVDEELGDFKKIQILEE